MDRRPARTSTAIKRFNIWFGGIFLALGLTFILVFAVLFMVLRVIVGMGNESWAFMAAPLGVGVSFAILGGAFMAVGLRRARLEARLHREGSTTEATVTAIEPTNVRVNRRRLWHIRYTYADLYGVIQTGVSGHLSAEDAQQYQVGEQACVRYDPQQPAASIWLGRESAS